MRALCGLALEKKKRRLARPLTAKRSKLSSLCLSEPGERVTRSQKQGDRDGGTADLRSNQLAGIVIEVLR